MTFLYLNVFILGAIARVSSFSHRFIVVFFAISRPGTYDHDVTRHRKIELQGSFGGPQVLKWKSDVVEDASSSMQTRQSKVELTTQSFMIYLYVRTSVVSNRQGKEEAVE